MTRKMAEKHPEDETDGATLHFIHNRAIDVVRRLNADAGSHDDPRLRCIKFYKSQSQLTVSDRPVVIDIQLSTEYPLSHKWLSQISYAIEQINLAAPGLLLRLSTSNLAKIKIRGLENDEAFCTGSIFQYADAVINIGDKHPVSKRTVVHELLHALGFEHEHKRKDAGDVIENKVPQSDPWYSDFATDSHVIALTRYDVFSIMHYPEVGGLVRKPQNDTAWKLKPKTDYNEELSELDKLSLNLVFPPWANANFEPKHGSGSKLFYCTRRVMLGNNRPCRTTTDEICGPNSGPNCPACRVLRTDASDNVVRQGRWQGWSGWVYCGERRNYLEGIPGHDGHCGPNNGVPCEVCFHILCPRQIYPYTNS